MRHWYALGLVLLVAGCGDNGGGGMDSALTSTSTVGDASSGGEGSSGSSSGSQSTSTTDDPSQTVSSTAPPITTTGSGSTGGSDDGPGVIFVNFGGGDFTVGMDDATIDQSSVLSSDMTLAAYDGPDQATILGTIVADFAPFDVEVTDQRPAEGPYAMVVITPTNFTPVNTVGVAPLDCDDGVRNSVAFAFTNMLTDAVLIGSVASSRLGSTFGLEQGSDPADLSYGTLWSPGTDPSWVDLCVDLDFDQTCSEQHAPHCSAEQQNSFAALIERFGPA